MRQAERLRSEQAFHNEQARRRALELPDEKLRFADEEYLGHESWIAPSLAQLGDVHGRRVLDFGCGHGMAAVVLARRGGRVTGFDLSLGYLREAKRRAWANGVHVEFVQASGEELPFANGAFDCVWGNAILHHLDLEKTAPELRRVLAPGGVAVFCEPWGGNPILAWARRQLPYPGKERTPDEAPLGAEQVQMLRKIFPGLVIRGQQLISMAARLLGRGRSWKGLTACDQALLARFPVLERYCRYVTLIIHR